MFSCSFVFEKSNGGMDERGDGQSDDAERLRLDPVLKRYNLVRLELLVRRVRGDVN